MSCNCNSDTKAILINTGCLCENEEGKKKYLDQEGLMLLMQLLKVAFEESPSLIDRVTSSNDTITLHYKDGTKQEIVISGIRDNKAAINALKSSPASLLQGLSPAEMLKFCKLIIQAGGGLAVDSNGQVYVDFDSMPTTKFENLMKQLRVPIWVSSTKYRSWYVDNDHPNASDDTTTEGRGQSPELPFKTIQACVSYITDNFNLSSFVVYINIDGGNYSGPVAMGQQNRTTGYIILRPYANATVPVVIESTGSAIGHWTISASHGTYHIEDIKIKTTINGTSELRGDCGAVTVTNNGQLILRRCSLVGRDETEEDTNQKIQWLYANNNARLGIINTFSADVTYSHALSCNLFMSYNATITFSGSNESQELAIVTLSGTVGGGAVFYASNRSLFLGDGNPRYQSKAVGNIEAGYCCTANGGSGFGLGASFREGLINIANKNTAAETSYSWILQ